MIFIVGNSRSGTTLMGRILASALPSLALLVAKMSIALPLNLSRTKNLRETLRRRFGKDS